jgi:methionyl-tRNA formyltransferase
MKVVYFGTPQFAADVLSYLLQHGIEIVAVVTKPDRPQGRSSTPIPTPVKSVVENLPKPIPLFQPEIVSASEWTPILEAFQADLFVVVAYGEIIKQHLLEMPKVACINLHASLLPAYRGAAPIQRSIINGEKESGITIMHMARKMDAGDMIAVKKVAIGPNMTYGELETELCDVGSELLLKTIRDFEQGTAERTPQDHSLATLAPKIEVENCEIDWKQSVDTIHNLVRGVNPHPCAWCQVQVNGQLKRLKVITTEVISREKQGVPGEVMTAPKYHLEVSCGDGVLRLIRVQLEGKKAMPAEELMRGLSAHSLQFINA